MEDRTDTVEDVSTFADLGLKENLLPCIADYGFRKPTELQKLAIPACISGRDVVMTDCAGSGKTVAVIISLVNNLDLSVSTCQVLHLTPYRECSGWTQKAYMNIFQSLGITCHGVVAGTKFRDDIAVVQNGVQVVVCTPGRMEDMLARGVVDVSGLRVLVVDETDDIVETKGMGDNVRGVFQAIQHKVQVIITTSTQPESVKSLMTILTDNPVLIKYPQFYSVK